MNWTKASAISEILSSVAILVTLFYLVIEIQQNAEATRAGVRQSILASDQQFLQMIISDPELNLMWYKQDLNAEERTRLSYFLITHVRMRENNWLQHQNGILDDATWQAYRGSLLAVLSGPQPRAWWGNFAVERIFDERFISYVNELIANQPLIEQSPHISAFN